MPTAYVAFCIDGQRCGSASLKSTKRRLRGRFKTPEEAFVKALDHWRTHPQHGNQFDSFPWETTVRCAKCGVYEDKCGGNLKKIYVDVEEPVNLTSPPVPVSRSPSRSRSPRPLTLEGYEPQTVFAADPLDLRLQTVLATDPQTRRRCWLQTEFAARHAARMFQFYRDMDQEAMRHTYLTIKTLHSQGAFKRWLTIDVLWEPDLSLLQLFGSLPDMGARSDNVMDPWEPVRCSPQLATFLQKNTFYKHPDRGPDPETALLDILRSCFVGHWMMFTDAFSPYQLLCSSRWVLDMAFLRAVLAASAWLGPGAMPVGYIDSWPPPDGEEGL